MKIRLQKILSDAGIASRRKAENYILQGRVKVNGSVVDRLGTKADPDLDFIEVNGKPIKIEKKVYIKLNKPPGYVSSRSSKEGKSVLILMKKVQQRIYPVGRLDKQSEGLLILTNDGDYADLLMHPKYEHNKEYIVELDVPLKDKHESAIQKGPKVHGVKLAPMEIIAITNGRKKIRIILHEGKKRQIRRVFGKYGYAVTRLVRVRVGDIKLGSLKPGQWKKFKP